MIVRTAAVFTEHSGMIYRRKEEKELRPYNVVVHYSHYELREESL